MKVNRNKISVSVLKTLPILCLIMLALSLIITMVFLYRNFYRTLAQMETLAELELTVARERINRTLWDAIIQNRLSKLSDYESATASTTTDSLLIRDPFQPW